MTIAKVAGFFVVGGRILFREVSGDLFSGRLLPVEGIIEGGSDARTTLYRLCVAQMKLVPLPHNIKLFSAFQIVDESSNKVIEKTDVFLIDGFHGNNSHQSKGTRECSLHDTPEELLPLPYRYILNGIITNDNDSLSFIRLPDGRDILNGKKLNAATAV
jgi:hypothetical protein